MQIAVCPGSFDPITSGHLDIIERASRAFDKLVIGVFQNPKKSPAFSTDERRAMIRDSVSHLPNVEVHPFDELLVDFAKHYEATVIVKGLRAISDFEYEFQMAQLNRALSEDVETMFMMAAPEYSFLSSSGVKEIASFGGSISGLVPRVVEDMVQKRLARN